MALSGQESAFCSRVGAASSSAQSLAPAVALPHFRSRDALHVGKAAARTTLDKSLQAAAGAAIFGMFVIVPPRSFVQAIEQYGYTGDFNHFYWEYYLTGTQALCNTSGCLALPTWNHLWFVLYLYIYTILLVGLLMLARRIKYETRYTTLPVLAFLTLPPLVLAAARMLLYRAYPPNDALLNDWYSHAIYGGFFLFGYFAATVGGFWDAMKWGRWPALMAAVLLLPSVWLAGGVLLPAPLASLALLSSLGVPLYQWTAIVAVCGFGRGGCLVPMGRYGEN